MVSLIRVVAIFSYVSFICMFPPVNCLFTSLTGFLPGLFLLIFRALFIKRNESFVCELSCKYCFPVCHSTFDFAESIYHVAES